MNQLPESSSKTTYQNSRNLCINLRTVFTQYVSLRQTSICPVLMHAVRYWFSKGASRRMLLLFLLLFLFQNSFGQVDQNPSFAYLGFQPLGSGGYNNESGMVISVDTDSFGNVYVLTFGNGVFKYNPSNMLSRTVSFIND